MRAAFAFAGVLSAIGLVVLGLNLRGLGMVGWAGMVLGCLELGLCAFHACLRDY